MAALRVLLALCLAFAAVQAKVCDEPCKVQPYDLSFVVDASSSIGWEGWGHSMEFLKAVVDFFEITPTDTRVAVSTYSRRTQADFELTTFTDKAAVQEALLNLTFMAGGYTATGDGIRSGIQQMKSRRSLVRTVMVVLTDGNSQDPENTKAAAQAARTEEIVTYVVGVGNKVTEQELLNIAGDAGRIARVKSYEEINGILGMLQRKLCGGEQSFPVCRYSPTDVTFIIDSSSSINVNGDNFLVGLEFITQVVDKFEISPVYTRVSAVTFSTDVHVETAIGFKENENATAVKAAVMALRHTGGNTRTDLGLKYAMDHFLDETRNGVGKIVILVTDGQATRSHLPQALEQASAVRNGFGTLLAVGVGEATTNEDFSNELAEMAGGMKNVVLAGDYDKLTEIIEPLVDRTCEEVAVVYAPAQNYVYAPPPN